MNNKNNANKSNLNYVFTRETLGVTLMLFSALVLVMLLAEGSPFSGIGEAICTFMYGTFGYGSLLVMALTAYIGVWLVFEKRIKISIKLALALSLTVFVLFLLFHAVSSRDFSIENYGEYIKECYLSAANGYAGYTFGGAISAIFVYPVAKLITFAGSYAIFSVLVIACGYLLYNVLRKGKKSKSISSTIAVTDEREAAVTAEEPVNNEPIVTEKPRIVHSGEESVSPYNETPQSVQPAQEKQEDSNPYSRKNLGRQILFEKGKFDAESYRRNMIFYENSYFNHPVNSESDYLSNFSDSSKQKVPQSSYSESYQQDVLNQPAVSTPSNYVYGEKPVDDLGEYEQATSGTYSSQDLNAPVEEEKAEDYTKVLREETNTVRDQEKRNFSFNLNAPVEEQKSAPEVTEIKPSTEQAKFTERTSLEEEEKSVVQGDSVDMFKLFGSSNTNRGQNRIEPDVSRLKSLRSERSKANLFDEEDDEKDDFTPFNTNSSRPESSSNNSESSVGRAESRSDDIRLGRDERRSESLFEKSDRRTESVANSAEGGLTDAISSSRRPIEERKADTLSETGALRKPAQPVAKQNIQPAVEAPKQEEKPKHVWKKYIRPGLELLEDYPEHNHVNTGEIEDNKRVIVETFARFRIDSEVANVTIGPAITRYDVIIGDKTKVKQALNYKEAIAMELKKENVTAYLNYSKGAVSIEVPNNARTVVGLKGMLSSQKFINSKSNSITFALGKNVEGEVVCPDITKMPHLLVAGTTGSGKSICLSSLLVSLLYKYGPEELRFILVDPKQVEFISYDRLPHLMINEIIYEVDKAIKALNWAIKEMERRYSLFKEMTEQGKATKNLDEYNAHLLEGEEKLPKIIIVLDEFGDLMLAAKKDIESRIIKLVQKARACGIHLILAKQRPSVDCITGLIKSNLPTRIGFKVNSFDDARTIFDIGGAEKLLGKGDLYFRSAESPDLARIQGCFIDTHEVQKVTDFVKQHNETYFDQSVSDFINTVEVEESANSMGGDDEGGEGGDFKIDDTYIKALYYCVTSNQASVSMIQRRFPVGYIKACKIIDWMENMNYVTPSEGSKPRKVLFTKEEFINTYGEIDD